MVEHVIKKFTLLWASQSLFPSVWWLSNLSVQSSDHVSYGGPPPMHRSTYRSIQQLILDRLSVDTRSSIGRYIGRVSDRCIDRYSYRSIYLVAHRDFTDTWPILHWYCTDSSLTLNLHRVYWLISVDISVDTLVDTRPVDKIMLKYRSMYMCICQ